MFIMGNLLEESQIPSTFRLFRSTFRTMPAQVPRQAIEFLVHRPETRCPGSMIISTLFSGWSTGTFKISPLEVTNTKQVCRPSFMPSAATNPSSKSEILHQQCRVCEIMTWFFWQMTYRVRKARAIQGVLFQWEQTTLAHRRGYGPILMAWDSLMVELELNSMSLMSVRPV